jgi:hypothetical protein
MAGYNFVRNYKRAHKSYTYELQILKGNVFFFSLMSRWATFWILLIHFCFLC